MARFLADQARYVGAAKMPGQLYDLGRYPGMIAAATPDDWVAGDIFYLGDPEIVFRELDRYEGATGAGPHLFERRCGLAYLESGEILETWWYEYVRSVTAEKRIASWPIHAEPGE